MTKLDIDYDVPMPAGRSGGKGYSSILRELLECEAGASIFFPLDVYKSVQSVASKIGGKGAFQLRKIDGGFRVWRV
jgi:hypothetical protein